MVPAVIWHCVADFAVTLYALGYFTLWYIFQKVFQKRFEIQSILIVLSVFLCIGMLHSVVLFHLIFIKSQLLIQVTFLQKKKPFQ